MEPYGLEMDTLQIVVLMDLFLPDISTILLNARALDDNSIPGSSGTDDGCGINLGTVETENVNGQNPEKLFNYIDHIRVQMEVQMVIFLN